ncbi:oligosaccharide flippase family protein [Patiriisocius marinus]|uniref:oligosaccharide flippase family protein n=1 Tax=Patiriisocius marinus TaxID=1397112 RepID=UPI00232C4230|nr:polysaccharide biosynthesis C-terminal domain-containing protein [Patiriisocius marinus]
MSKLVENSFLVVISKVITLVLGIASSIFFVRLIGANGKGDLTLLETSAALIVLVTSLNLNFGIIHFVSKKEDPAKILGISIYVVLFSLLITGVLLAASYYFNFSQYLIPDGDFLEFSLLLFAMIFILETKEIFSSFLKGFMLFKDLYVTTIIYSVFRVLLFASLFMMYKYFDYSFTTLQLLWAHVLCLSLVMIFTFFFFLKKINFLPNFNLTKKDVTVFLKYCVVGLVVLVINFLSRKADIWIIDFSLTKESLGYYAVAIGLCDFVLQIPMTLRSVLFPYLSSTKSELERVKLLSVFSRFNFTIIFVIAICLVSVSNFLIPIMFGSEFEASIVPFQILVFAISFIGFRSFLMAYFMSIDKQKVNVIGATIGLITLLLFDFVLVPRYGIVGAAYGALISYFLSTAYIYFSFYKNESQLKHNLFFVNMEDIRKIKSIVKSKL